ncbi:MAG: hypothetical protein VB036_09550 [Propionicimonas sp.]|nr:hypothetical protein [Propionicimonas sp.]
MFCVDAYTTEPGRSGPQPFLAAGVKFESLNAIGLDPIPVGESGLSAERGGYFTKSPLYLDDGVAWAEVTVIEGDASLAWVPASVWTSGGRWLLDAYLAPRAHFESCDGSYTGFLGGLLTSAADECLTLGVSSSLRPEVQAVRVAIGRDACN